MPNAVKYSTTIPSGSLLKGTVALGVTTASISGPTSTTGWYYGPNPVTGKYQIIETAASGDPDVYCPQSDAELIQFVKTKGATGANTASLSASLAWIGTQTNLMAANFEYENIVTDGLVMNLDAGFVGSYPTTASTWYDLSGNAYNGALINGPTFNSANSGSIVFDGVDDSINYPTFTFTNQPYTLEMWGKLPGPLDTANRRTIFTFGSNVGEFSNTSTVFTNFTLDSVLTFLNFGFSTAGSILLNTPFHWVFTVDSSNLVRIYFNGTPTTSPNTQLVGYTTVSSQYNVFGVRGSARLYNGNLYTARIYNKALSSTEVLQNYNAQKARFGF
jgi:hypothetical protein